MEGVPPAANQGQAAPLDPYQLLCCDESGNTGTNHLDEAQRYYVCAGLAVAEATAPTCREAIKREAAARNIKAQELKGSRLLVTPFGRAAAAAVIRAAGQGGAFPFYTLVEKRYALATRAVEAFLDPPVNPKVPNEWLWNPDNRRNAAQSIGRLPTVHLTPLQRLVTTLDPADGVAAIETIAVGLKDAGDASLGEMLLGATGAVEAAIAEMSQEGTRRLWLSPNHAAFLAMVQMVDHEARRAGMRRLTIVHDDTSSFRKTFEEVFAMLGSVPPTEMPEWFARRTGMGAVGLHVVDGLRFTRSHDDLLVQAADLVAATVLSFASGKSDTWQDRDTAQELGLLIGGPVFVPEMTTGYFVMDDRDLEAFQRRVVDAVRLGPSELDGGQDDGAS